MRHNGRHLNNPRALKERHGTYSGVRYADPLPDSQWRAGCGLDPLDLIPSPRDLLWDAYLATKPGTAEARAAINAIRAYNGEWVIPSTIKAPPNGQGNNGHNK